MRILFTGASSFSGFHFVTALARAGNDLICPVRGRLATYAGLRRERVERLQSIARIVNNTAFGDESFLKLISDSQPVDLLCHHAADVANYKSPDFDRSEEHTSELQSRL